MYAKAEDFLSVAAIGPEQEAVTSRVRQISVLCLCYYATTYETSIGSNMRSKQLLGGCSLAPLLPVLLLSLLAA
jgi:hypothetical protein